MTFIACPSLANFNLKNGDKNVKLLFCFAKQDQVYTLQAAQYNLLYGVVTVRYRGNISTHCFLFPP